MAKGSKAKTMDKTEDGVNDILNRNWSEMSRSAVLPIGDYKWKARSGSFKATDDWSAVTFVLVCQEAMETVDADALEELGDNYDLSVNTVFHKIFTSEASDWDKVRDVLTAFGIDVDNLTIKESLKAVKGREIVAYSKPNTRTDNRTGELIEENVLSGFKSV